MTFAAALLLARLLAGPAAAQSAPTDVLSTSADVAAVSSWADAIAVAPGDETPRRQLAQFVQRKREETLRGTLEQRQRALEQALRLDAKMGDSPAIDKRLAGALEKVLREKRSLNSGELADQRLEALEQALRIKPKLAPGSEADLQLDKTLERLRREAAEAGPALPSSEVFFALIAEARRHYARGEDEKGFLALRVARLLSPDSPALAAERSASSEESARALAFFREGTRLDDAGKTAEAADAFQKALAHDPGNGWIMQSLEAAKAKLKTKPPKGATKEIAPEAPAVGAPVPGVTTLTVTWKPVAGAVFYLFLPSGSGGSFETTGNSLVVKGLTPNTPYSGKVRAKNAAGGLGAPSAEISAYTLAAPPRDLRVEEVGETSMTVAWDAGGNPPGTKYLVGRSSRGGALATTSTTETRAVLTGASAGTVYSVDVRAQNGDGLDSAPASAVEIVTKTPAPEPPAAALAPAAAVAPAVPAPAAEPRIHVVKHGDTFEKLAQDYYGDAGRWRAILKANPQVKDQSSLARGMRLTIPALPKP